MVVRRNKLTVDLMQGRKRWRESSSSVTCEPIYLHNQKIIHWRRRGKSSWQTGRGTWPNCSLDPPLLWAQGSSDVGGVWKGVSPPQALEINKTCFVAKKAVLFFRRSLTQDTNCTPELHFLKLVTTNECRVLSLSDCRYSLNPLSQTRIDWVGRYRIRWTFKLSYA